ncbi:hypothetical protein O181_089851, partial [Austropuccinia psidii MF-1]|nr:hypothetical protein [Austropuccinia psidii MF-1]
MPQDLNPPLEKPELSRDPYETPLSSNPPLFIEKLKVTEERISMINFVPSGWLSEEETNSLKYVILLREKTIAFCEEERGVLKHSYGKPYKISVISHETWQKKPIPIPKSILPQFIELKPNGKLRIVHDLQDLNKVTINNAGLPPNVDELLRAFSGRACYGLGDIMGVYDERELDINTIPLNTFEKPLGRLPLTRLPQGATNSVAFSQAQMTWILQEEIPEHLGIFIDEGGIKGPRSTYQHKRLKENRPIRRFVWKYAVTLERILFRIEEEGLTISGSKFACCVLELDIVGHVVLLGGRKISKQKINKIENWPRPTAKKEVRGFLGLCAYVRMLIKYFSQVSAPLRRLTREDVFWKWDEKYEEACIKLRKIVGEEITLKRLNYEKGSGKIKLAIDSSYIAAGAVLMKEDENGKDRPVLYESVTFSQLESKYSQLKLELCGVARILKRLQTILWGKHFELQVDAKALIEIINTPCLPNAPMTRWVAFIQLFSFDLVHKLEWICRYGAPKQVTVDGGAEFVKEVQEEVKRAGSRIRITTPYYPEAQGMVERGHKRFKDALVKMCGENGSKWKEYLPTLALEDRILVKRTTGYSPFELHVGKQAVLPIDIEKNTYLAIEWNKISTTEELLEARAIHISAKEETKLKAEDNLRDSRKKSVQYLDKKMAHKLRNPLQPGDLVLVYNKT